MSKRLSLCVAAVFVAAGHGVAMGQSVPQRIAAIRMQRNIDAEVAAQRAGVSSRTALRSGLETVSLQNVSLKNALEWLHNVSGLNIVIHWPALELIGVTPDQPVTIAGASLTVEMALNQIIKQMSPEQPLVWEITPWYVEIMTKDQANQKSVTLVYPIGDLLQTVPNFDTAPNFDLAQITQGGQGGGASSTGLFGQTDQQQQTAMSRQEHADQLADLIRTTVEPDIWKENGGTAGSIAFYRDALVIRAPMYVHRQIGGYTPLAGQRAAASSGVGQVVGGRGGAIGFDPTVGVVNSGSVIDVTGSTSDLRYVTLSGGVSNARVNMPIRTVPIQATAGGAVNRTYAPPPAGMRYGRGFGTAGIGR